MRTITSNVTLMTVFQRILSRPLLLPKHNFGEYLKFDILHIFSFSLWVLLTFYFLVLTMHFFNSLILAIILLTIRMVESSIIIDPTTCPGVLRGRVQAALVDMGNIARLAYACTDALKTNTQPPCNPRVILNTFQAYFGSVTDGNLASRGDAVLCM